MIKYVKIDKTKNFSLKPIEIESKGAIKYIAQTGTCGYACAAKGYLADYVIKGVPIKWQKLTFDNSVNDLSDYVDALAESTSFYEYDNYETLIVHSTPDIWKSYINNNKSILSKIGYCTWETNRLPVNWIESINLMPEVWVPSNFNKETFIESGVVSKIKVVPHIWHDKKLIDKSLIKIYDYCRNEIPSNKYTFYSIGELNFRKGIEDLVTTFDGFNEDYPDTQLILKVHYKEYSQVSKMHCIDVINKLTNKLGKSIYLILDNLSNKQILALHSFGDCYVSLNKGEGFGLTVFDAFNLGKNVIVTGYGGQLDYLGKNFTGLVNFKINKVSGMESFSSNYREDQEWAYPDLDHAYCLMKTFYENKF